MSSMTSLIRFRTAGIVSAVMSLRVKSAFEGLCFEFELRGSPASSKERFARQLICMIFSV